MLKLVYVNPNLISTPAPEEIPVDPESSAIVTLFGQLLEECADIR